jgi:DNA-binding CsgD family transcriptional regulator
MHFTSKDITHKFLLPLWNDKSLEVVDDFLSPDAAVRTTFLSGVGPAIVKKNVSDTFKAFSNFEIKINEFVQQNNKLVYQWQAKGRHEGTILGIQGKGREAHFAGIGCGEIKNDKIMEYQIFSNIPQVLHNLYTENTAESLTSPQFLIEELSRFTDSPLTRRELECLSHWLNGCTIKESAKRMGDISTRTIQTYREHIKGKFGIHSYQQLFGIVQQSGVLHIMLQGIVNSAPGK